RSSRSGERHLDGGAAGVLDRRRRLRPAHAGAAGPARAGLVDAGDRRLGRALDRPAGVSAARLMTTAPTVLITGSSSGIGRAAAERFAARGFTVFASMRRPEAGAELRALAAHKGWRLTTPALDVTRDDSVESAVDAILRDTEGGLDVLVNNAGY